MGGSVLGNELIGQMLQAHFNLRSCLWSLTARSGPDKGRVVAHVADITLLDAVFKVSEASHRRTKRIKKRTVHAWVIGLVAAVNSAPSLAGLDCVTYQPKPHDPQVDPYFRIRGPGGVPGEIVTHAPRVICAKTSADARHGYAWIPRADSRRPAA
jgi:hypothetical protein